MSNPAGRHSVLYWNRATPELYAIIREQAPAELEPVFLETEDPAEARAKLARAEFLIVADWALTPADLDGAPHLRLVQHQGVGYERIDTAALASRKIPLCLCPAGTATGVANMGSMTGAMLLQPLIRVLLDLGWTGETNYLNARAYGAQAWRGAFLLLLGWLAASLACALATRETHARQVR